MKTIVLNHKMNLYYNELNEYITRINNFPNTLIIAPSNSYLIEFKNKCKHQISSQDICYIEEGNYTSKVSWRQIKSIGINYSIIGHSEKDEDINKTNLCENVKEIKISSLGEKYKSEKAEDKKAKEILENLKNFFLFLCSGFLDLQFLIYLYMDKWQLSQDKTFMKE